LRSFTFRDHVPYSWAGVRGRYRAWVFNSDDIGAYASYIGSDAAHLFAAFEASLQASLLDQLSASTPSEAVFEHGYSGESSRNLGPHLVEAPWTLGKSGSSYGLTISSLRFRRFDGEPLNNIFDEAAGTGWSDFFTECPDRATTVELWPHR